MTDITTTTTTATDPIDLTVFQARVMAWVASVPGFANTTAHTAAIHLDKEATELDQALLAYSVALALEDPIGGPVHHAAALAELADIVILVCNVAARLNLDLGDFADRPSLRSLQSMIARHGEGYQRVVASGRATSLAPRSNAQIAGGELRVLAAMVRATVLEKMGSAEGRAWIGACLTAILYTACQVAIFLHRDLAVEVAAKFEIVQQRTYDVVLEDGTVTHRR